MLPEAVAADADRLRRFEQEARATGLLDHPNILAVYDVGTDGGRPYVVSELLEGETLRGRLAEGALPVRKAIELALQCVKGLAAAHEKGIVHRDLKPENLFVTTDGRLKILDFGLAKLTQGERPGGGQTLVATEMGTEAGIVLGTAGYMAPEQIRAKPVDHRVDIFAFGAILYEMLAGKRAFHGESTADTMTAILKEDPPDLTIADRAIPPALERIVRFCLEKNPGDRFQSARDLALALEATSGGAPSSSARTVIDAPEAKSGRRVTLPAALAAVSVVAALGFAVGRLTPRSPSGPLAGSGLWSAICRSNASRFDQARSSRRDSRRTDRT